MTSMIFNFFAILLLVASCINGTPVSQEKGSHLARRFTGHATYFAPGTGACGATNSGSDYIVAMNQAQYAGGSLCQKTVSIKNEASGKSVQAKVVDKVLPGLCLWFFGSSPTVFSALGDMSAGVLPISWQLELNALGGRAKAHWTNLPASGAPAWSLTNCDSVLLIRNRFQNGSSSPHTRLGRFTCWLEYPFAFVSSQETASSASKLNQGDRFKILAGPQRLPSHSGARQSSVATSSNIQFLNTQILTFNLLKPLDLQTLNIMILLQPDVPISSSNHPAAARGPMSVSRNDHAHYRSSSANDAPPAGLPNSHSTPSANRASSVGPFQASHHGTASLLPPFQTFKDPRPRDRKTLASWQHEVYEFLQERGYPEPLLPKTLQTPTTKDFQISSSFSFNSMGFVAYDALTKSGLQAPGSMHVWPTLLAMLQWIVTTIKLREEAMSNDKMRLDTQVEPSMDDSRSEELAATSHWFPSPDWSIVSFNISRPLFLLVEKRKDRVLAECERLEERTSQLEEQRRCLASKPSNLAKAQQEHEKLNKDDVNFSIYVARLRAAVTKVEKANEGIRRDLESREARLREVSKKKKELAVLVAEQNISDAELQQISSTRAQLERQVAAAEARRTQLRGPLDELQVRSSQAADRVEKQLTSYKNKAVKLGLIPRGPEPFEHVDFTQTVNGGAAAVADMLPDPTVEIKPALIQFKRMRSQLEDDKEKFASEIGRINEQIDNIHRRVTETESTIENSQMTIEHEIQALRVRYDETQERVSKLIKDNVDEMNSILGAIVSYKERIAEKTSQLKLLSESTGGSSINLASSPVANVIDVDADFSSSGSANSGRSNISGSWHSFKLSRPNLKLSSLPPRNRLLSVDRPSQLIQIIPLQHLVKSPQFRISSLTAGKNKWNISRPEAPTIANLEQHATNVGYVTRILARDRQQIATSELNRWLTVIDRVYGGDHSWTAKIPSSLLAELASKRLKNQTELTSFIAALMSQPAARNKTPTFRLLGHLVKALINLCGSLPSALNRLSKPNVPRLSCNNHFDSIPGGPLDKAAYSSSEKLHKQFIHKLRSVEGQAALQMPQSKLTPQALTRYKPRASVQSGDLVNLQLYLLMHALSIFREDIQTSISLERFPNGLETGTRYANLQHSTIFGRKITRYSMAPVSNAMLTSSSDRINMRNNEWKKTCGKLTYVYACSNSEHVVRIESLPSMPASISRSSDPQDKARSKIAATIIPSLSYTTRWTKIIPNRSCFKDMIEFLLLHLPISAITHRLTGLDEFVEGWIQEIDGQVIIHDDYEDEQIQEELGNLQNPDQPYYSLS
ncbi:hypothetical protein H4Q26_007542 [Puccinia striiformis f. sp. tritici PST-130]|nr:hypothetical protein H4Q26_007542 [Puccinia striiformis f. sp. tritici PST-130]